MADWLAQNATAIQAGSAIVQATGSLLIIALTAVLIWVTNRYARTTDRQYREMVATRQAAIEPHIHVDCVHQCNGESDGAGGLIGPSLEVVVRIVNMFPGPAIGVKGEILGPEGRVYYSTHYQSVDILGNGTQRDLNLGYEQPPQVTRSVVEPSVQHCLLAITYRDLLKRRWQTKVPITIPLVRVEGRDYTYAVGAGSVLEAEERTQLDVGSNK